MLLRAHRSAVAPTVADVPGGSRGYQVLVEVVEGGQPSQLALAQHLGIDRTAMTYLVDELVEAGLVERRPNPADRRQRLVVATSLGRRRLAAACGRVAEAEEALLGGLDAGERAELRRLLARAACHAVSVDPAAELQQD